MFIMQILNIQLSYNLHIQFKQLMCPKLRIYIVVLSFLWVMGGKGGSGGRVVIEYERKEKEWRPNYTKRSCRRKSKDKGKKWKEGTIGGERECVYDD